MFDAKKMKKYVLAAAFGACLLHGGATAHAEDVYATTSGDSKYYVVTESITETEDGFTVIVKKGWTRFQEHLYKFRYVDGEWESAVEQGQLKSKWKPMEHPVTIAIFETANEYR